MNTRGTISILIVLLAGAVHADSVSIGYSPVPLQREYIQTNLQTGDQAQKEATYSPGTFQILYTVEKKAAEHINLTLTTGVGLPAGSAKFGLTSEATNPPAVVSKNATNEGD